MGKGGKGGGASCLVMVFSFLFFLIAFGLAVGAETRRSQVSTPTSVASCHTLVYLYICVWVLCVIVRASMCFEVSSTLGFLSGFAC